MAKVSRGVASNYKHKKILKLATGFYGRRKSNIRIAKQAVNRAMTYRYKSNRLKKRCIKSKFVKYLGQYSNIWFISHKLMMAGLFKLDLKYNLPVLYSLVQSKVMYCALLSLFALFKQTN